MTKNIEQMVQFEPIYKYLCPVMVITESMIPPLLHRNFNEKYCAISRHKKVSEDKLILSRHKCHNSAILTF